MPTDQLQALRLAREGKWDDAHRLIQPLSDSHSFLIHGYLHRVEGDLANAAYWYRRAGQSMPANTLEEEAQRLASLMAP